MPAWTYTDHFFCLFDKALLYRTHKHSNFLCSSTVKEGLQKPDFLCRSLLNWPITTYHLTEGFPCSSVPWHISFLPSVSSGSFFILFSIQPGSTGTRNMFWWQNLLCVFHTPLFLYSTQQGGVAARGFLLLWNYIHLPCIKAQIWFASWTQGSWTQAAYH